MSSQTSDKTLTKSLQTAMSADPDGSFEFGSFRLDANERRLACDGRLIPLTPKAFRTLVVLVENWGHVLGKDELIRQYGRTLSWMTGDSRGTSPL